MLFCSMQLIGFHEIVTEVSFTEVFLIPFGEPSGTVYNKSIKDQLLDVQ